MRSSDNYFGSNPFRFSLAILLLLVPLSLLGAKHDIVSLQPNDLPSDVVSVSNMLIGTMRHRSNTPQDVEIVEGARKALTEPGFSYEGFNVSHYSLVEYRSVGKAKEGRSLKLALRFDDELGRSAMAIVSAIYRTVGDKLRIEYATLREQHPQTPTVQLFAVPTKKFPKSIKKVASSYLKLYQFAVDNAVPVSDMRKVSKRRQRYVILAFVGERMPPDAKLDLLLDSQAEGLSGSSHGAQLLDYKGWRVLSLPVSLTLRNAPAYFLKVIYTPGATAPNKIKGPKLLASYATSNGKPVAQPKSSVIANNTPPASANIPKLQGRWHQESQFGFKMLIPKGWQSQALTDGTDRVLTVLSPDGNVAARVRAIPINGSVPLDKVVQAFEQYALSGGQRLAQQQDTMNGMHGLTSVYRGDFDGTEVGMGVFATLQGRYAYIVWGMIPLPYFDQRSGEVDAMLNSFTLM